MIEDEQCTFKMQDKKTEIDGRAFNREGKKIEIDGCTFKKIGQKD